MKDATTTYEKKKEKKERDSLLYMQFSFIRSEETSVFETYS